MRLGRTWGRSAFWWVILLGCGGGGGTPASDLPSAGAADPDSSPWDSAIEDVGGIGEDSEDRGPADPGLPLDRSTEDPGEPDRDGALQGPEGTVEDPGPFEDPSEGTSADPGSTEDRGATEEPAEVAHDEGGGPPDDGSNDEGLPDPGPGPWTVRVTPDRPEDVVASYLMSLNPTAWNLFGGESLPLGRHFDAAMGHVSYHSAIRFPGLPVPPGARVLSARLSFLPTNEVDSSNTLWLAVHAERSPDSPPLSLSDYDRGRPDQRLRTVAAIDQWVVRCNAFCTELTEYDCPQRKRDCWDRTTRYECPKDLRAIVQEVIDLPGWRSGNALTILLQSNVPPEYQSRDRGARHIVGVDPGRSPEDRPALEVTFEMP